MQPERPDPSCRYCLAAWGDLGHPCGHDEREQAIARRIAETVWQSLNAPAPTDKEIGWFMDDAELICAVIKDPEPVVHRWEPKSQRLYVGDTAFKVDDESGALVKVRRRGHHAA